MPVKFWEILCWIQWPRDTCASFGTQSVQPLSMLRPLLLPFVIALIRYRFSNMTSCPVGLWVPLKMRADANHLNTSSAWRCAWHRVGPSESLVESIHLPTQPSPHPHLSIHPTNHPASHLFIIHQRTNPSTIYPSRSSSQPPTHYSLTHSSIFLSIIHSSIHPFTHSPFYPPTHPCAHPLIYYSIYWPIHTSADPLTH